MSSLLFCYYFNAMVITLLWKKSVAATCFRHWCLRAWNFFRKYFFYRNLLLSVSSIKNHLLKIIQCVFMFPWSFALRIVWRLSRFHSDAPRCCIEWLCFIFPGEQDNNLLTGHQVFSTRLKIALPFQERMKNKTVRSFAVRALILIFREFLKNTGED